MSHSAWQELKKKKNNCVWNGWLTSQFIVGNCMNTCHNFKSNLSINCFESITFDWLDLLNFENIISSLFHNPEWQWAIGFVEIFQTFSVISMSLVSLMILMAIIGVMRITFFALWLSFLSQLCSGTFSSSFRECTGQGSWNKHFFYFFSHF